MEGERRKKLIAILNVMIQIEKTRNANLLLTISSLQLINLNLLLHRLKYSQRRRQRIWCLPRPQFWFHEMLRNTISQSSWKKHFRINKSTFDYLYIWHVIHWDHTARKRIVKTVIATASHVDSQI